ncbi:hypothetical protein H6G41_22220 [Tolypothrix sp. FACHB-123]|uniref:hypothetical protein n=1 Tax=Tolypothrix sp. FACHB-123 TaxID=2692868 RepID=UPI00168A1827|nr:hypothetical protein [Tolypothrix sp. FACHB-123]MBD2357301.1 hypothetical protein [Tolypothrix sp. FACHB-123]
MHIGTQELHNYLKSSASSQTCYVFSALCRAGWTPQVIFDEDCGVSIQCHEGNLILTASSPDDWVSGAFSLMTINGITIARFGLFCDTAYIDLTLAMLQNIANEFLIRLEQDIFA